MAKLSESGLKDFKVFTDAVKKDLVAVIQAEKSRFTSADKLLARYEEVTSRVLDRGTDYLNEYHESHNELVVAIVILEDKLGNNVVSLEYEPLIDICEKRFDFHAKMEDGTVRYIEVKTIHPMSKDDWKKYEKAIDKKLFPENTELVLVKDWLGGELYHNTYASRSKMLEYTLVMEKKTEECLNKENSELTFLVLFTNGFHWHLDELEDFVFFYRNDNHFPGDPFSSMESHYVEEKGIEFTKRIDCFSFIKRPKMEIRPSKIVWNVAAPNVPY